MATATATADTRIHSAVYHKRDRRVNDIIRRCRKSEIISLYDVECCMLFRVEQAHMEFDTLRNHRPYIMFAGNAEGVFLPEKTGLLFPNACDQLDFRSDYPVAAKMLYALSDLEIATLANNGLFNSDWSCQGRIIGSLLEIPCRIDYSAVAGTPVTFIEIQDRLSLNTSTAKTGYKTLVTAFLPYQAQKHNEERRAELLEQAPYDRTMSEIRRRGLYDTPSVGFSSDMRAAGTLGGVTFVEAAQERIKVRMKAQMDAADALGMAGRQGTAAGKTAADAVKAIQERIGAQRSKALKEADESGIKVQAAVLDARLNDMSQRMIYAGGSEIPVEPAKADAKSLAEPSAKPMADVGAPKYDDAAAEAEKGTERLRSAARAADGIAEDIAEKVGTAMSRKEKLAKRRAEREATAEKARSAINKAADDEAAKGMSSRAPDRKVQVKNEETGELEEKTQGAASIEGDVLSEEGVDIDGLIRDMGLA